LPIVSGVPGSHVWQTWQLMSPSLALFMGPDAI
jgi:hypothetical protein